MRTHAHSFCSLVRARVTKIQQLLEYLLSKNNTDTTDYFELGCVIGHLITTSYPESCWVVRLCPICYRTILVFYNLVSGRTTQYISNIHGKNFHLNLPNNIWQSSNWYWPATKKKQHLYHGPHFCCVRILFFPLVWERIYAPHWWAKIWKVFLMVSNQQWPTHIMATT